MADLSDKDATKTNEQQGLYRKFEVKRVDGSDHPGGRHHGCRYFVLDVDHDPHAQAALTAYALACGATHPDVARDLREKWGATPQPAPSGEAVTVTDAMVEIAARAMHPDAFADYERRLNIKGYGSEEDCRRFADHYDDRPFAQARRALEAALSTQPAAPQGWKPIGEDEPAPPHAVPVLLWSPPSLGRPDGQYEARPFSTGRSGPGWSEYSQHSWATHWMPLPAAPSKAEAQS